MQVMQGTEPSRAMPNCSTKVDEIGSIARETNEIDTFSLLRPSSDDSFQTQAPFHDTEAAAIAAVRRGSNKNVSQNRLNSCSYRSLYSQRIRALTTQLREHTQWSKKEGGSEHHCFFFNERRTTSGGRRIP
jgi:hypothetical protein